MKRGVLETAPAAELRSLKVIKLTARKIEEERVTVVDLAMNERRSDGLSRGIVESVPDSTKVTNG